MRKHRLRFIDTLDPASGSHVLTAFYEQYPQEGTNEIAQSTLPWGPGDEVEAYIAPGGWALENYSQDKETSGNWNYTIQGADSAEGIAERFADNTTRVTLLNFTGVGMAIAADEGTTSIHFCQYVSFPYNYGPANNAGYLNIIQGGTQVTTTGCTGVDEFAIDTEGTGY